MSPKHTHDCPRCKYLGSILEDLTVIDGYVCEESVILRYSSEPSEYWSWPRCLVEKPQIAVNISTKEEGFPKTVLLANALLRLSESR